MWVNCAVLCVKDDWKGQFWGLRYCLSKLRSLLSFCQVWRHTVKSLGLTENVQRPLHSLFLGDSPAYEDGTECAETLEYKIQRELPRREHTTFRTGWKFEIRKSGKLSHGKKKTSAGFTFLSAMVDGLRECGASGQQRSPYNWRKSRKAWIMALFDINYCRIYLIDRSSLNRAAVGSRQLQTAWKARMSDCKGQPVVLGCLTLSFGTDRLSRNVRTNHRLTLCNVPEQRRSNQEIINNSQDDTREFSIYY